MEMIVFLEKKTLMISICVTCARSKKKLHDICSKELPDTNCFFIAKKIKFEKKHSLIIGSY